MLAVWVNYSAQTLRCLPVILFEHAAKSFSAIYNS